MLKEIIPPNLLQDENIKALVESIEPEFENIKQEIINVLIYPRIDELSEEVLDILAYQFHIEGYDLATDIIEKRNLIKKAIELHRYKGTKWAIERVLELLGLEGQIKEWYETLGELPPYTFSIITEKTPTNIERLIKLVNEYKNVRSNLYSLTDGRCKKLGITNISYLNKTLFNSGEGREIDGVKVCFKYNEEINNNIELTKNIYTSTKSQSSAYSYYPFIKGFNYSNLNSKIRKLFTIELQGRIFFYSNLETKSYQEIYKSPYSSMNLSKFNEDANFIDRWEIIESRYFNKETFNNKSSIFADISRRIKRNNSEFKSEIDISKIADFFITAKSNNYKKIDISIKNNTSTTASTNSYLNVKRNWVGRWEGKWTDDYKIHSTIEVN